ncbi:MAG: hypothetical protein ABII13_01520 [Patescibacteria group bacterium]|nr:hypothetical protein [Patescibacteria group bacterium]MBU2509626.1 hypothetical protein [Patescibacteria group bacterium]
MTLPPLLRPSYWFDPTPIAFSPVVQNVFLIVFGTFLFVGIFVRLVALKRGWEKMTKRFLVRISGSLMVLGVFGLVLYILDLQRVSVLSARVFYILWLAALAWYIYRIVKFAWVDIPAVQKKKEERERIEKWLPKKK